MIPKSFEDLRSRVIKGYGHGNNYYKSLTVFDLRFLSSGGSIEYNEDLSYKRTGFGYDVVSVSAKRHERFSSGVYRRLINKAISSFSSTNNVFFFDSISHEKVAQYLVKSSSIDDFIRLILEDSSFHTVNKHALRHLYNRYVTNRISKLLPALVRLSSKGIKSGEGKWLKGDLEDFEAILSNEDVFDRVFGLYRSMDVLCFKDKESSNSVYVNDDRLYYSKKALDAFTPEPYDDYGFYPLRLLNLVYSLQSVFPNIITTRDSFKYLYETVGKFFGSLCEGRDWEHYLSYGFRIESKSEPLDYKVVLFYFEEEDTSLILVKPGYYLSSGFYLHSGGMSMFLS